MHVAEEISISKMKPFHVHGAKVMFMPHDSAGSKNIGSKLYFLRSNQKCAHLQNRSGPKFFEQKEWVKK